jgi:GAF domain-containing protein
MVLMNRTYSQSLYSYVAKLNSSHSQKDVIRSIVEGVARTMNAKGCALMLLTSDREVLLHTASFGLSDWFVRKGPVILDISMSETLAGKSLIISNAETDERVYYRQQLKQEGIASVLSVPVKLRDEVIGVLRVYSSRYRQFTDDDVEFANLAASFGAIALESAHYYSTLQQDYDTYRQDMLQWRAELGDEGSAEPAVIPPGEPDIAIPPGG